MAHDTNTCPHCTAKGHPPPHYTTPFEVATSREIDSLRSTITRLEDDKAELIRQRDGMAGDITRLESRIAELEARVADPSKCAFGCGRDHSGIKVFAGDRSIRVCGWCQNEMLVDCEGCGMTECRQCRLARMVARVEAYRDAVNDCRAIEAKASAKGDCAAYWTGFRDALAGVEGRVSISGATDHTAAQSIGKEGKENNGINE